MTKKPITNKQMINVTKDYAVGFEPIEKTHLQSLLGKSVRNITNIMEKKSLPAIWVT